MGTIKRGLIAVLVLLSLLLILPIGFAQHSPYYADLTIDVKENGYVQFMGDTNYDDYNNLQTSVFTSKEGEVWTLNLNSEQDNFSNYYFELKLPERAIINYMKAPNINIDTSESRVRITGFDEDAPVKILIQYRIGAKNFVATTSIASVLALLLLVFGFVLFRAKFKPEFSEDKSKSDQFRVVEDIDFTNDRQKIIYEYVLKKKRVSQKELEKNLDMPKSSLSRNIDSLYRKGLIEKKRLGMSNILKLKKI